MGPLIQDRLARFIDAPLHPVEGFQNSQQLISVRARRREQVGLKDLLGARVVAQVDGEDRALRNRLREKGCTGANTLPGFQCRGIAAPEALAAPELVGDLAIRRVAASELSQSSP